jgi:hypothetical protein
MLHPDLDSEVQAGTIGAGLTSRDYLTQDFQILETNAKADGGAVTISQQRRVGIR